MADQAQIEPEYQRWRSATQSAVEVLNKGFTDSLDTVAKVIDGHSRSARAALHALVDSYLSAPAE